MNILLVHNICIPAHLYGSSERVIWWLGKFLVQMGHNVTFLVKKGSECPFAPVLILDEKSPIDAQIPENTDIVHFHCPISEPISKPYLVTIHENSTEPTTFDRNSVFLSDNHARRHGATVFVYNGLDFSDYGEPILDHKRIYFHFMANAPLKAKNVQGCIDIASKAGERLHIIGETRTNFRMGLRIMINPSVRFHGMLGGDGKNAILNTSKGLIFPVLWHEPFGLAVIESLYFGCPVFGTPYGALPELLGKPVSSNDRKNWNGKVDAYYSGFGCLSLKKSELVESLKNVGSYDREKCHEYVRTCFSAEKMTQNYILLYEKVLNGQFLHEESPVLANVPEEKFPPLAS